MLHTEEREMSRGANGRYDSAIDRDQKYKNGPMNGGFRKHT